MLLEDYPRMMLQITLQVMSLGRDEERGPGGGGGQGESYLPVLAGLVNAAVAGCLDAAVGMRGIVVATTVAVMKGSGELKTEPGLKDVKGASSLHVLGFNTVGELVLVESEGRFSFEEWEGVEELARRTCLTGVGEKGDVKMQDAEVEKAGKSLQDIMRGAVEAKVMANERWREG